MQVIEEILNKHHYECCCDWLTKNDKVISEISRCNGIKKSNVLNEFIRFMMKDNKFHFRFNVLKKEIKQLLKCK